MSMGWISEKGRKLDFNDLLEFYKIYQDRQKLDLDMHLRFANWYTVMLTALTTASLLAFGRYYENAYASLFVGLPLLAIALIYQGKLATFRFYRRYTEGRVRLTKIEHLWGLDGPIWFKASECCSKPRHDLWPLDRGFLPRRYFKQSFQYKGSGDFIRGRGSDYGIGYLTDRTFNRFLTLSWIIVLFAPVALYFIQNRPVWNGELNVCVLAIATALGGVFHRRYRHDLRDMISETPRSNIIAVDFDGTIADTLIVKKNWIKDNLGRDIDLHDCEGTFLRSAIGDEDYKKMFAEVFTRDKTLRLEPIPGALNAIGQLQKMCQVMVVTARTGDILLAASEWLSQYDETRGLEILGLSKEFASKGHQCAVERVELLIDDDSGHLSSAESLGIDVIMFKFNAPYDYAHESMEVFRSWQDVTDRIDSWLKQEDRKILSPSEE